MQLLRRASASDGEQRALESEGAEIEAEARQLWLSLEQQEAWLPEIESELAHADAFRDTELEAARRAEDERARLGEEARRVARGERWVSDGSTWRSTCGAPVPGEEMETGDVADPSARDPSAVRPIQGQIDFEELEARRLRGEFDEMEASLAAAARQLLDPTMAQGTCGPEEIDLLTEELREEIAEERSGFEVLEAKRQHIAEAHSNVDKEEAPLRDWVDHVEVQLRAARAESAELQADLVAASERRAEMQREDLHSLPLRQAGVDVKQVWELEYLAQECQTRKANLREEISMHRAKRDRLLLDPWPHERPALASESAAPLGIARVAQLVQLSPPNATLQDTSPAWSPREPEDISVRGPIVATSLPPHPFCEAADSLRATPQNASFSLPDSFASGDGAAGNYWDDLEEFR